MKKIILCVVILTLFMFISGCGEQQNKKLPMAFVEKIENGQAFIKHLSEQNFNKLQEKASLFKGDIIKTEPKTEVLIRFSTGAVTRVMPNTQFEIKSRELAQTKQKTIYTRLIQGIAYFYVPKGSNGAKKFEVETNRAIASIKGTKFKVIANSNKTTLMVAEGLVEFIDKNLKKSVNVAKMQAADITDKGIMGPYSANTISDQYFSEQKLTIYTKDGE